MATLPGDFVFDQVLALDLLRFHRGHFLEVQSGKCQRKRRIIDPVAVATDTFTVNVTLVLSGLRILKRVRGEGLIQ